jgi:hypothetical protein
METILNSRRLTVKDSGVADLLDEGCACRSGEFFGKSFAFVFESLETNFYELMPVEEIFQLGEKFGRSSGFAEFECWLEELRTAFEFA